MELEHTFTVPVTPDVAFRVLRDIERIGPCMPGATIESVDGDEFSGKVKVKVGPIQVTYRGTAAFVDIDEDAHSATIEAEAKEARGSGTANATIRASCEGRGGETDVRVVTELAITGRPAQFGRGVMADVGAKLLGKFAACLAEELADDRAEAAGTAAEAVAAPTAREAATGTETGGDPGTETGGDPGADAGGDPVRVAAGMPGSERGAASGVVPDAAGAARQPVQRRTDDTIDLLDVAAAPVAKRAAPVLAALALLALVVWLIRRR